MRKGKSREATAFHAQAFGLSAKKQRGDGDLPIRAKKGEIPMLLTC
jgi:hypothetical protein